MATLDADATKDLVRRYIEDVWGRCNLHAVIEIVAEEYVDRDPPPGTTPDRAGLVTAIQSFFQAFSDICITLEDVIVDGAMAADRWSLRATHAGDFAGIPATGKSITLTGMDMHRIRGGQIVETWHREDIPGLILQLRGEQAP